MARSKKTAEDEFIACTLRELPAESQIEAAAIAVEENPANSPAMLLSFEDTPLEPARIAALTSKYWGAGGVDLTVGFPFDSPSQELRSKVISHMNAWGQRANVKFRETNTSPQVRIALTPNEGYWSYLGTDVLLIPRNQPTMNLERFSMSTPDKEFYRVVRHETGHTLGMPHEHLRRELVQLLDPAKTIAYFQRNYGWSAQQTQSNVLTPVEESSLLGGSIDQTSVMCYALPGAITRNGQPIPGGMDINAADHEFAARIYPSAVAPPPPPPPPEGILPATLIAVDASGKEVARYRLQSPLTI